MRFRRPPNSRNLPKRAKRKKATGLAILNDAIPGSTDCGIARPPRAKGIKAHDLLAKLKFLGSRFGTKAGNHPFVGGVGALILKGNKQTYKTEGQTGHPRFRFLWEPEGGRTREGRNGEGFSFLPGRGPAHLTPNLWWGVGVPTTGSSNLLPPKRRKGYLIRFNSLATAHLAHFNQINPGQLWLANLRCKITPTEIPATACKNCTEGGGSLPTENNMCRFWSFLLVNLNLLTKNTRDPSKKCACRFEETNKGSVPAFGPLQPPPQKKRRKKTKRKEVPGLNQSHPQF